MSAPQGADGDDEVLAAVAAELAARAESTAVEGPWTSGAFALLARHGMLARFVPRDCGGTEAAEPQLLTVLMAVAEACLTTALTLSQWAAAVRLIAVAPPETRTALLPPLAAGTAFTTVGISQITTSRQHVGAPALAATSDGGGWQLDGCCPWVTGADAAEAIVTGAVTADGGRMFFVVPARAPGVIVEPPLEMLALSGSRTSAVRLEGVRPLATIPAAADAPRTGGLATTALALGAARASVRLLTDEARRRPTLTAAADGLAAEVQRLADRLDEAASRGIDAEPRDALRGAANSLVNRAAQAALTAAKGAGFVRGHPAERRAREALFFLVWSCPPAVAAGTLCELAGVG